MREFQSDHLKVKIYGSRQEMGIAAAREAACYIKELLKTRESIHIIFAAAPSQNEFLQALRADTGIRWEKVKAFHMDEYAGLPQGSPSSFSGFLNEAVFQKLPFQSVNCLIGDQQNPQTECRRYSSLLLEYPADIVFMGIGENGHLAFNDPPAADFHDKEIVKLVELDQACRQQQVNDGCFPSLSQVPTHAYTVTIPALLAAKKIFCIVPGKRKANAVKNALTKSISESCPASILRTKEHACLYLDTDSAGELE